MKYLDLTFPSPEANLACDEALMDACESGRYGAVLRFWESPRHFVVLGYSNKAGEAVNRAACRLLDIPILRRPSGGGAVLQGPGCLNYALVLKIPESGPLASLVGTNQFIMESHRDALSEAGLAGVEVRGTTDLAVRDLKFSGNAQRRKHRALLFHGTFLHHFDIPMIETVMPLPSRLPDYRKRRAHAEFLTNVRLTPEAIKAALKKKWAAADVSSENFSGQVGALVRERYSQDNWNFKF